MIGSGNQLANALSFTTRRSARAEMTFSLLTCCRLKEPV